MVLLLAFSTAVEPSRVRRDCCRLRASVGWSTATQLAVKGGPWCWCLERYLIPGGSGGSFERGGANTFGTWGASMIFASARKVTPPASPAALAAVGEHQETPRPLPARIPPARWPHRGGGRDYDTFIERLSALFPHEASGHRRF